MFASGPYRVHIVPWHKETSGTRARERSLNEKDTKYLTLKFIVTQSALLQLII